MHNKTVSNFLKRNSIDEERIKKIYDTNIYSLGEIDPILEDFAIYSSSILDRVSIADIYGFDYRWRGFSKDIFLSLDSLFDEDSRGYKKRSVDNLLKTSKQMLESPSFSSEPMEVIEVDEENKIFTIGSNGLHRYSALKVLYLNELYHIPLEKEELKEKYKVLVSLSKIDKIKTYCNFIISRNINDAYIKKEVDSNCQDTGNSILVTNDKKEVLTDEELLAFSRNVIDNNPTFIDYYSSNPKFISFIQNTLYNENIKEAHHG